MKISAVWTLIALSICLASGLLAGEPNAKSRFEAALETEAQGNSVNRKAEVGETDKNSPLVRWLSGELESQGKWSSFEELGSSSSERMQQYREKRAELAGHINFHHTMARWCQQNELPDLAKAHFCGALLANPNDVEARAGQGDRWLSGRWFSAEEVTAAQTQARQLVDDLEKWLPKINRIAKNLLSTDSKEKLDGIKALELINSEEAVPALEMLAQPVNNDCRKMVMHAIGKIRSRESCFTLARLALIYFETEAGQIAVRELKKYPDEMYVPELLQLLSSTSMDSQLVAAPNGRMALVTLVSQELKDAKYTQRLEKSVRVLASVTAEASVQAKVNVIEHARESSFSSNDYGVPLTYLGEIVYRQRKTTLPMGRAQVSAEYVPRVVAAASTLNLNEDREASKTIAAQHARAQQTWNHRVCEVLRATTDAGLDDTPASWWSWWINENERYESGKPTYSGYRQEHRNVLVGTRYRQDSQGSFDTVVETPYRHMQWSCLVSGTLIQTFEGLRPIETIQIGDLVMAQDVETGELALKPVMLTTVRPPKSTLRVVIADGEIQATGGHLWWVSGRGWVKTRDLQPGMQLHNATGTTEVRSITENVREVETYNLVVDGFHTYFVGKNRVLSYDNTLVKPTLRVVPGYSLLASANVRR